MKAKQLIEELQKYPQDMDVFIAERKTEFAYGLLNSSRIQRINFKESPDDIEVLCREDVIVLDEE